jgi:hypothetical protein
LWSVRASNQPPHGICDWTKDQYLATDHPILDDTVNRPSTEHALMPWPWPTLLAGNQTEASHKLEHLHASTVSSPV